MTKYVTVAPPFRPTKPNHSNPKNQLEPAIIAPQTDETTQSNGPPPTPFVDNSAENVDNSPATWDDAIRDGERRRAEEFRRVAEQQRRDWLELRGLPGDERGPPGDDYPE